MSKESTSRVAMVWPEDLKDAVREKVGPRGITSFTLDAVRAKLHGPPPIQDHTEDLEEARFLTQRLADTVVMSGEYEKRFEALQEIELPDWIDTTGWPDEAAQLVKPEPEEGDEEDLHRPMALVGSEKPEEAPPTIGDPGTVRPRDLPHDQTSDDLLERVRAKAAEKGVDLSGMDLKPASTIEKPPAATPEVKEPEPVEEPAPASNACPECKSEMVGDECWECM